MWSEKPRIIFDHRLEIISWVWVGIFFFLALNLWYLCVFQFNLYQKKSDLNRIRVIPLQAPRGTIYDRDGKVLAQDVPRFAAILLPGSGDPQEARQKLEGILGRTLNDPLRERFSGEIILTSQIQSEELARVEEAKKDLPGIMLEAFPRRAYPAGESVFHVLGYVGKINAEELGRFDEAEYNGEDVVGKNGIELFYENILRGEKGYRKIEVDALGRIVRMLDSSPPRFRHSLVLSIDLDLQNFCYQL
ncbi:MAG: penicillin-binding protein 2, partial [Candidatus Atribacteria bacterium]|nr:penicillin-binding protein 2 [Candidatus Atribacteria bacterium]